ncbi:MAG: HlyD family efflux transporter periplasmic adaptor subunit [Gammaproteobacteria bacterium]
MVARLQGQTSRGRGSSTPTGSEGSAVEAVQVKPVLTAPVRHPVKAARLLYSLPSLLLRGPIYLIFVIVFVGLVYAFWAKQDVLVTAPIVLEKDSFTVQVTGGGLVTEVYAKGNSLVRAGDPLAVVQEKLSPLDDAQREALDGQKFQLEKERDKVASEFEHKLSQLDFELNDLINNRGLRIEQLESRISILRQQLGSAENARRAAEGALAIAQRQYQTVSKLFESRDATVTQRDQALEKLNAAQKSVFDSRSRISELSISLNTAESELREYKDLLRQQSLEQEIAQTRARQERDLRRLDGQIEAITGRLSEAMYSLEGVQRSGDASATYTSLFDGVITQLHVNRGQVIPAGAPLITLVRDTAVLEGHAFVENKDIGQLKRGQAVKIKYFAYPFQEYGIANGFVSSIATTPSGRAGQESKYLVKVALRADTIRKPGGRPRTLEIGLEGLAEFKAGERRFIEILFSPISKFLAPEEEAI